MSFLEEKFNAKAQRREDRKGFFQKFALFHPIAAFDTKQWATENFARVAEFLGEKGLQTVAVATKTERGVLDDFKESFDVSRF